jgi:uncharacterized protein YbjQ (UPF0145 family)
MDDMLVSTTSVLDGKRITRYLGIVSGEAIMGANILRDLMAGIRDIIGGRSAAYEESLREAKNIAMQEMIDQARSLGANGIIGIDLDYESIPMGNGSGMMMVTAAGTAINWE